MNTEEKQQENSDNVYFEKINNPIKNLLINKGIIEIIERFASHGNEDIRCLAEQTIEILK